MVDNGFIQIVKEELNRRFNEMNEEQKTIIIYICSVLFYLEADSAFMKVFGQVKDNDSEELIEKSLDLFNRVINDFEFKIRIIENKEFKLAEDHRFLFFLQTIKNYSKKLS